MRRRVVAIQQETASAKRITLEVPSWPGNDAGSHLDVRLTAPDGYQASRSYSIASSGETTRVVLAVDEVPDGEVSPFLVHDLRLDDMLEVHGPLGNYFIWDPQASASHVQLIAGGSGVVPLFAMAEAHDLAGDRSASSACCTRCEPPRTGSSSRSCSASRIMDDSRWTTATHAPSRTGWPSPPGRLTRDVLDHRDLGCGAGAQRVRLRADAVRRGRRRLAGGARARPARRAHRAIRRRVR